MNTRTWIFAATLASLCGGSWALPAASAAVLDFEGFANGQIIDDEYAGLGVTISADSNRAGFPDLALINDTSVDNPRDPDLNGPFSNPTLGARQPGNILIIQEFAESCGNLEVANICAQPDDEENGGQLIFDFAQDVVAQSLNIYDIDAGETGGTITLFDRAGNSLAQFAIPDVGDNAWMQILFGSQGTAGVARIVVNLIGEGGIDELAFAAVPVPAAVWLFGSALVGLVAVRRRNGTVAA